MMTRFKQCWSITWLAWWHPGKAGTRPVRCMFPRGHIDNPDQPNDHRAFGVTAHRVGADLVTWTA